MVNHHHFRWPSAFLLASFLLLIAAPAPAPVFVAADNSTYIPRDYILLNCGSSGRTTDNDGRFWNGDTGSKFAPSLNSAGLTASKQAASSVPEVPYMTARIFTSQYTYSFPVGPGRKFIRLYFYPANYSTHAPSNAFFDVTCNNHTLLSNFSAFLTVNSLNYDSLTRVYSVTREYSVNTSTGGLDLTFTPSSSHPNAFAFINGIEIVSMPDIFTLRTPNLFMGGSSVSYSIEPDMAMETMYRFNVGGKFLSTTQDSGLYRTWSDDTEYIFGAASGVTYPNDPNVTVAYTAGVPSYTAPLNVYSTARSMGPDKNVNLNYNLTWIVSVDAGFYYLVRFHFCEIQNPMTKVNQRVFDIFVNNQTVQKNADVIAWSKGIGRPVFKDYVVFPIGSGQMDMWVALHPDPELKPQYYDAILNGLEVFKIENGNASLAGLNPPPRPQPPPVDASWISGRSTSRKSRAAAIAGGVAGGLVFLIAGFCLVGFYRRRKAKGKDGGSSDGPSGWLPLSLYGNSHSATSAKTNATGSSSSLPGNLCHHFSFAEIKTATKGFDESLLLGVGGFGNVYRGEIDGGTNVAIKRGNPMSGQGEHEFQTEIEMLSKLRHRHLVSLIGYCDENCEMILVYDYMAHGTLRDHLYKTQNPPLTWRQRLEICIGAARGLHYLHTGSKYTIIHRDVKTTNILLDQKWVAKVSDFGLSKTGPMLDHTHVSTVVKGSLGYLDPEYYRRQQLTDKSDVYSFGVVLFEVLCARPALNPALPKEQVSLAEWAVHCQKKGMLEDIVDPYLMGKIAPQCLKKFAEIAEKCVLDNSTERPSMGDVLWNLEFALQLQQSAEESGSISAGISDETPMTIRNKLVDDPSMEPSITTTSTTSTSMEGQSLASVDSYSLTPSAVFSQIMNPKGR
ncbi:receptor-like protein kinase FERONIA [Curcuma longa]|uniref:receptor-like protein kinase FERONIA n=1 Tax=Curcuma longa TaxID=136217 RepID=UPI003D9F6833